MKDAAIENSLYQSASDLTEPSTASGILETANRSTDKIKSNVKKQIVGYNIFGKEDIRRPFGRFNNTYKIVIKLSITIKIKIIDPI